MKIYPEIEIRSSQREVEVITTLRKKHYGKYYLWYFRYKSRIEYKSQADEAINNLLEKLRREVYFAMTIGKINTKLKYFENGVFRYVFEKDENQQSEEERLKREYEI